MTEIPFSEGYSAALLGGTDPRLCSYDKMTKEWNEWQRGYSVGTELSACYLQAPSE